MNNPLKSSFHLVVTLLRCRQVQHALVEPPFVNSLWKCSRFHIRLRDGKRGRNQLLRWEGWQMLKSQEFSSRKVLNESRNFQNKKHRESEKQIEILLKALFLATEWSQSPPCPTPGADGSANTWCLVQIIGAWCKWFVPGASKNTWCLVQTLDDWCKHRSNNFLSSPKECGSWSV